MKKKYIEKRTKFITNTYMREAIDYDIVTIKEGNLFITIKKYKSMTESFKLPDENGKLIDYIAKDYYVVDLTPLGENYNIRYYFDNKKNYIDYYIDITLENGERYKMPYYIDLYLDILSYPDKSVVKFYDEDELEEALKNKIISKKDYNLAYKVGKKLKKEIEEGTNKYMNIDVLPYINKYFK